jgi:hypothetical protein
MNDGPSIDAERDDSRSNPPQSWGGSGRASVLTSITSGLLLISIDKVQSVACKGACVPRVVVCKMVKVVIQADKFANGLLV